MHSIPFDEFPSSFNSISTLFRTYMTQFDQISKFYNAGYKNLDEHTGLLQSLVNRPVDRIQLASILEEQQRRFKMGEESERNAAQLQNKNTFAVVTGQQVGILGGPIYTVYKIITALKLSDALNNIYSDYTFIPVFYLEAEDHDYDEVSKVSLINIRNDFQTFQFFPNGKPLDRNPGPVGSIVFDESINEFLNSIETQLQPTEFRSAVMERLRSSYANNSDFTLAFILFIGTIFRNSGLVVLDPRDKSLKQLLRPVFQKEIQSYPKTSEIVIKKSALLEEHFHAQAKPRAINLFLFHRGGRYLIEPRENGFTLKGARQRYSRDEILALVEQSPDLFSPNVILRPICQDYLLPTFVYIGGPSEIAYFAQLKELYSYFNVVMPVIYPRISVTIIEEKVERIMQKFELSPIDFFKDMELIQRNVTNRLSDVKIDDLFQKTLKTLNENLKELKYGLQSIDPTLAGALDTSRKKIEYHINRLKEKTYHAQRKNYATAMNQIARAALHVAPNNMFQERVFPLFQYCNKYGFEIVDWLYEQADIKNFDHQLFYR